MCVCVQDSFSGDGSSFYHGFWGSTSGNQVCTARALNTWAISTTLIVYFDCQIYLNIFMMVMILLKSKHISYIDQTKAIRMTISLNCYHSFVVSTLNGSTSWNVKSLLIEALDRGRKMVSLHFVVPLRPPAIYQGQSIQLTFSSTCLQSFSFQPSVPK